MVLKKNKLENRLGFFHSILEKSAEIKFFPGMIRKVNCRTEKIKAFGLSLSIRLHKTLKVDELWSKLNLSGFLCALSALAAFVSKYL